MDPVAAARHAALELAFNALWRRNGAVGRRLSRTCRRGSACAIISLASGAELAAPLRGFARFGFLRTGLPYFVRLPESAGAERVDSAEELLALLADERGQLEQLQEW